MAKHTALDEFHKNHGGRMVEFAGWSLPVMYSSIIEEHMAVRESAGFFDVSHMGQCIVRGAEALQFLNFVLTNDFTDLAPNSARYSLICNNSGECIDDLIVNKFSDEHFLIVLNASNTESDMRRLNEAAAECGFDVSLEDISDSCAMLAVQGARSADAMKTIFDADFSGLAKFAFLEIGECIVSRTGYTGSDGFEIICPNADAQNFAEKFLGAGVKLCGLGARDSLRLEARYPLYGHELSREINPFEARLGWAVKLDKNFAGRDVLKKIKGALLKRKVVHFKANDRRIVRDGEQIYCGELSVGKVLSGAWSPVLNAPIMSALVDVDYLEKPLHAKVRGNAVALELCSKFL